ncbi:hypothetical protein NC652_030708 [Populus alba x Populus x berolinensis]|nr:hypothetical protein NC652_030708 [Populus alba x Populus x berolinensis]
MGISHKFPRDDNLSVEQFRSLAEALPNRCYDTAMTTSIPTIRRIPKDSKKKQEKCVSSAWTTINYQKEGS